MRYKVAVLLFVCCLAATLPVFAGYVDNNDGKFDGRFQASAQNRTQGSNKYRVVASISGDNLRIEFSNGTVATRIRDIFDWGYELEFNCRDEKGDSWRVSIDK